jgi:hypothetical protein
MRKNILGVLLAVSIAAGVIRGTAIAQTTASVPKPQDRFAIGENEVKQLLLLMDADKNDKISKPEYIESMEEFDRLDANHNGELDVKERTQSNLSVSHFTSVGK